MHPSISASQWGSPTAPKKALLIHGLTAWSGFMGGPRSAISSGRSGFFVVAPNLLGHAWRRGTDYRMSTLAEDLRPYFIQDTSYDVIVGHSLGGPVTLSLLQFLPKTKETAVILLDPPLELEGTTEMIKSWILNEAMNIKYIEEVADDRGWSRRDCVLRVLSVLMCDRTTVEGIFSHNEPWSFSGLLRNIPPHVKITVLASDPKVGAFCDPEHIPCDVERLNVRVLPGIGHSIQYEDLDAIMDLIQLPKAKL